MKSSYSITLFTFGFAANVLFGQAAPTKPYDKMTPEERKQRIAEVQKRRLRHFGGSVEKPGSQKGLIVFVNGQKQVKESVLRSFVENMSRTTKLNIKLVTRDDAVSPENANALKSRLKANVAVFIADSCSHKTVLLAAPEENWAIVNSEGLFNGAKNDAFKETRLRKEMTRAFYACAGAMNGQQTGSLMGAVKTPADLDRLNENPPLDVLGRTINNLQSIGVTRTVIAPYRRACEQGWAPAPTNEYQKAIWDKVHAMPTAPIKIKPETKKVSQ